MKVNKYVENISLEERIKKVIDKYYKITLCIEEYMEIDPRREKIAKMLKNNVKNVFFNGFY